MFTNMAGRFHSLNHVGKCLVFLMDRDTMDAMDVMDTNGRIFMDRMDTYSR
jgi:hypothetical protein